MSFLKVNILEKVLEKIYTSGEDRIEGEDRVGTSVLFIIPNFL